MAINCWGPLGPWISDLWEQSVHSLKSTFFGIFTAGLLSSAAMAAPHDPNIVIDVTTFPATEVTLTSPRYVSSVAYKVVLQNNTTNTLNRAFFSATTSVVGATTNDSSISVVPYVEVGSVSNCTLTGQTSIRCDIGTSVPSPGAGGTLQSGQGATFWVVVTTPTAGTTLNFNSTFGGDEGNGGGNGCCNSVKIIPIDLKDALTSSTVRTQMKSFVNTAGGTFFTGLDKVATRDDPWVTIVEVPTVTTGLTGLNGALPFTTVSIFEDTLQSACSSDLRTCNVSTLKVPGTFASLRITLRRDSSTIRGGATIENSPIYYIDDLGNVSANPIPVCAFGEPNATTPRCIFSRREYTTQTAPTREWVKDWEWVIYAITNGGYRN
jgi:hypothetical protein